MKKYVWIVIVGLLIPVAMSLYHSFNAKRTGQKADPKFLEDIQSWAKGRKCNVGLAYEQTTPCGDDGDCHFVTANCAENALEALNRVCRQSSEAEKGVTERVKKIAVAFEPTRIRNIITLFVTNDEKSYEIAQKFVPKGNETVELEESTLSLSGWVEKKPFMKKANCKSAKEITTYLNATIFGSPPPESTGKTPESAP